MWSRSTVQRWWARLALAMGLAVLAAPSLARAQFHVKEGDVYKWHWEFESINAVQSRFPRFADGQRTGHELGIAYGFTDFWIARGLITGETPDGRDFRATRFVIENEFVIRALANGKSGVGLAWFQTIEAPVNSQETYATIFGPIVKGRSGSVTTILNPFFEKTFGQNHEPGVDFVYGWQTKAEVTKGAAIGVELYGRIPDIGNAPSVSFQEHRIGPVLILESPLGIGSGRGEGLGGPTAELELGMLFGLTDATAKIAGKANFHIKY